MSELVIPRPPIACVPVREGGIFPVRRIFCVGRNYADHAREMGHTVDREKPFYFSKSATALSQTGATLPYPPGTNNYHFEMELVVAIGAPAFRVAASDALSAVFGYACALGILFGLILLAVSMVRDHMYPVAAFEHGALKANTIDA